MRLGGAALLLGGMALSLLRTVRGPNDWAEAHWLLDYRFGFVKRGLPGQLLTWITEALGVPVSAGAVAAVAWTALVVFVAALVAVVFRIVRRTGGTVVSLAVATAFVTSPFAVLVGHLNGYFDHVFLTLGLLSIGLALRGCVFVGSLVQVVALLVHESCILLIWPAFVFACLLRQPAGGGRRTLPLLFATVPPLLTAAVLAVMLAAPPAGFAAGYEARLRGAGFVGGGYEASTVWMLTMSLPTMWGLIAEHWRELAERHAVAVALVVPNLVVLMPVVLRRAALRGRSLPMLAAGVVLLPLAMHAVAWDVERIWTYTLFTVLAVTWILAELGHGPSPAASAPNSTQVISPASMPRWIVPGAAVVIVLNLLATVPLLDFAVDRIPFGWRVAAAAALLLQLVWTARGSGDSVKAPA